MKSVAQFHALAARRRKNPIREARRQAHLTRMSRRMDFVPRYSQIVNNFGDVVGQKYLGHVQVRAR